MKSDWYCTECRCYHEPDMDIVGNCYIAEGWYEESSFYAWLRYDTAEQWKDSIKRTQHLYKVHHDCGHMTIQTNRHPLSWCHDCTRRMEQDRYNRGIL